MFALKLELLVLPLEHPQDQGAVGRGSEKEMEQQRLN